VADAVACRSAASVPGTTARVHPLQPTSLQHTALAGGVLVAHVARRLRSQRGWAMPEWGCMGKAKPALHRRVEEVEKINGLSCSPRLAGSIERVIGPCCVPRCRAAMVLDGAMGVLSELGCGKG